MHAVPFLVADRLHFNDLRLEESSTAMLEGMAALATLQGRVELAEDVYTGCSQKSASFRCPFCLEAASCSGRSGNPYQSKNILNRKVGIWQPVATSPRSGATHGTTIILEGVL